MMLLFNLLRKLRGITNPLVRDFTPTAERSMVSLAKKVNDEDENDTIFDSFIGQWLDRKGLWNFIVGINNYQKAVIDYYNYGANDIRRICEQARQLDKLEGNKIANILGQSEKIINQVNQLNECLNPASKKYSEEQPISDRLLWFSANDDEIRNWYVSEMDNEISTEDVISFCSDSENEKIFDDYTQYIYDKALNWSGLDIVFLTSGTIIYKGVEISMDELVGLISKEGYSEKQIEAQLNSLISSVISANRTISSTVKDWDEAKNTIESLCKDYLEDTSKESTFKSFVEAMGGITAIKELNKTAPQLLDYLLSDYSRGLDILNNMKKGCSAESDIYIAISKLEKSYSSKWNGILSTVIDYDTTMIGKITEEGIKDWLKKECGDYSVLTSIIDGTKMKTDTEVAHTLFAQKKIQKDLRDTYVELIRKINSGNYEETDIASLKNIFSMLKENTKSMYLAYSDACQGNPSEQIEINDRITQIEKEGITILSKTYTSGGILSCDN